MPSALDFPSSTPAFLPIILMLENAHHSMADTKKPGQAALSALVDKIALEIVFTEPGKDNGLLPINCLLTDLEQIAADFAPPAPMPELIQQARRAVDGAFDKGAFDAQHLHILKDWATWMQNAVAALDAGLRLPAAPTFSTSPQPTVTAAPPPPAPSPATALPPEEILTMNLEGDAELLKEFVAESQEHLQNIELGVLTLEENPTDADTLNSIFRAFHTFKGGSGFLNLRPINKLAHELESLLDLARQQKLTIDSEITNIILTGGDTLNQFVREIEAQLTSHKPAGPIVIPTQALLVRIRAAVEGGKGIPRAAVESPVVTPLPAAPPAGAPVPAPATQPETPPAPPSAAGSAGAKPTAGDAPIKAGAIASVKVDTAKLDSLVDLVGEMVIAQSMVAMDPNLVAAQSQQLTRNLAQLSRITKELQRVSMSLRMVPIRGTFQKMTRVVRDLSVKAGKQVQLEMDGEDTELDRNIVEELNDPLVHMIRNSMDHGIEKADARLAQGKSPYGTVGLRAFHQGGNIVIEVRDDGAGLNRERILQKAVERGLIKPDAQLTDKEVFAFIFDAGFSTAEKVTDISGRGVGMDVVRRNIEKLRGKIEIESSPGKGSKFSIHLPLTLAIIDGLIVSVGGQRYILPTLTVRESFRPTANMISTVHERGELVNVRGRLMPLLRLHDVFDLPTATTDPTQAIVVVVEHDSRCRCILVDQLLGKQEVVIKSLGDMFKRSPGLAGAAILGDGRVGLILDTAGLMELNSVAMAAAA